MASPGAWVVLLVLRTMNAVLTFAAVRLAKIGAGVRE
jgi:hypothetical protein